MRWLLVMILALLIFSWAGDALKKIGLGKLPGDIDVTVFGKRIFLPLASALVLSFLATGLSLLI